jgi:hypothetical protein
MVLYGPNYNKLGKNELVADANLLFPQFIVVDTIPIPPESVVPQFPPLPL